ncbi:MAG: hypothetical protein ACKVP5_17260 [Aestuariivirga sp.]
MIFLQRDEAMFSEALRMEFPGVRFFRMSVNFERDDVRRIALHEVPDLATLHDDSLTIVFPEVLGPVQIDERLAQDRTWYQENRIPDHRYMSYQRGGWEWETSSYYRDRLSYDPPTPQEGMIQAACYIDYPQHKMHLEIIKRVWKAMSKVAIGKCKVGTPQTNELMFGSDVVLMRDQRHRNPWIGHWAFQWCREGLEAGERRRLGGAFRPCDDWEMPKTVEYQNLCRIVDEKYGRDFGKAPTEPKG